MTVWDRVPIDRVQTVIVNHGLNRESDAVWCVLHDLVETGVLLVPDPTGELTVDAAARVQLTHLSGAYLPSEDPADPDA